MSWWTYVTRTSGTDSPKAMATRTGIDSPHFSKWKNGLVPGPQIVATFARAYRRPVLEAFVEAGFLTPEDARQRPAAAPSLSSLTDQELLAEIEDRMQRGSGGHARRDATPMKVVARKSGGRPNQSEREAQKVADAEAALHQAQEERYPSEDPESKDEKKDESGESA